MSAAESLAQLSRLRTAAQTPPIPPMPRIQDYMKGSVLTQEGAKRYDLAMDEWRKKSVNLLQGSQM